MTRVQIPAYTDMWARGARFGTVIDTYRLTKGARQGQLIAVVKMDHPQVKKLVRVFLDDCTVV